MVGKDNKPMTLGKEWHISLTTHNTVTAKVKRKSSIAPALRKMAINEELISQVLECLARDGFCHIGSIGWSIEVRQR